eukprot:TRINITY_DN7498_c0_g1_i1.p1 TRINITY_DN7498_c0_g1~~TRINITY_DN7498_c0_g1_i1.p1  ORF type:complete len:447 (-),score=46.05 TRINITY_DN7498_c0_g1_i1:196-1488(-)
MDRSDNHVTVPSSLKESFLSGIYFTSEFDLGSFESISTPERRHGLGRVGLFIAIFKANIGCGILFMPRAWSYGGSVLSTLLLVFAGFLSIFCSLRLVECRRRHPTSTYGEMMVLAVGAWGSAAVDLSIVMYQFGLCCTYLFTVGDLLRAALLPSGTPLYWVLLGEVVVFIPLAAIRKVSKLAVTNILGTFLVISGIMTVLVCEGVQLSEESVDLGSTPLFKWNRCLIFFGTAAFAFEGVGVLLHAYDSAAEPQYFPFVFTLAMSSIIILVVAVGLLGSFAYGEHVDSQVLLSIRQEGPRLYAQVAFATAMMATFPLQLLPGILICEKSLCESHAPGPRRTLRKNCFRGLVVITLALIAFVGASSVDHFVSIIGAFCGVPLNFIYPLVCHQALVGGGRITRGVNVAFGLLGGFLTVATTILNIADWVQGDG